MGLHFLEVMKIMKKLIQISGSFPLKKENMVESISGIRLENKILKTKLKKRIVFTDNERRTLVDAALAMGRDLMEQVVTIVKPKTIFAWQRRLEKQEWDYSDRRKNNSGRPRIALDIEALVCRMARENAWAMHGLMEN